MPGSHRGRPRRLRAFAPAAVASVVAVLLVVGAIVAVDLLHHHSSSSTGSPTVSAPATLSVTSSSSTPTPTPTPTTPTPSATRTATRSATPTHTAPAPVLTPAPSTTPVAVYNNSRVARRAELASSRLRADGYPVTHTATRSSYPGSDVVYFPPGNVSLAAAARGLVARHIGIVAAEPRPASIPGTAALIVVVGASYR